MKHSTDHDGGRARRLDWPSWMRPFCVGFLLVAGFVCFAATEARPSQRILALGVSGVMAAAAVYLAYGVFFTQVWWDRTGIGASHPFGRRRFVPWGQVTGGGYRPGLQAFLIQAERERVWYSPAQTGLDALHRYMSFRLRHEGRLLWHGIQVEGEAFETTIDEETGPAGFYVVVWVRDASADRARERAIGAVEGALGPLRRTAGSRMTATLLRSALEPPALPAVSDDIRRTGFAVHRPTSAL